MALYVYAVTLFVSAFILFLVQPLIGKMILPKLGGTPGANAGRPDSTSREQIGELGVGDICASVCCPQAEAGSRHRLQPPRWGRFFKGPVSPRAGRPVPASSLIRRGNIRALILYGNLIAGP